MATKYVSTTGNDSAAGDIGTPWLTINHGVVSIASGDTLYVRAGTYVEALNDPAIPSGANAGSQTTIKAYPGETVWMKPAVGALYVMYFDQTQSFITFDGIGCDQSNGTLAQPMGGVNATSGTDSGIFFNAHSLTWKNTEFLGNRTTNLSLTAANFVAVSFVALATDAVGFNQLLNCKIHGGGGTNFTYGFYIQSGNNILDSCEIYDMGFQGGQFYDLIGLPIAGNTMRKCRVHDITQGADTRRAGVSVSGQGNLLYDNLIYNITAPAGFDGLQQGIQVLSGSGAQLFNNTIYNAGDAITLGTVTGTQVINNIAWGAPGGAVNGIHDYGSAGTLITTNSWQVFPGVDPLFVNSAGGNFHLQTSSPAVGTGTTVTVPDDLDGVIRTVPYSIGCYVLPGSGGGGGGNWTLIAHGVGTSATSATVGPLNTVGADLIVVLTTSYNHLPSVADISEAGATNTWHKAGTVIDGSGSLCESGIFYAWNANTNAAHSITVGGGSFPWATVLAFKGSQTTSDPFDDFNGAGAPVSGTIQPGAPVPTVNNDLFVSSYGNLTVSGQVGQTISIIGALSWAITDSDFSADGIASAWAVQATAAAENPTWTITDTTDPNGQTATIACFKSAPTTAPKTMTLRATQSIASHQTFAGHAVKYVRTARASQLAAQVTASRAYIPQASTNHPLTLIAKQPV